MGRKQDINRLEYLYERIRELNHYYYDKFVHLVSDAEYDRLVKEVEDLEAKYPDLNKDNSPSETVSKDRDKHFKTAKHNFPMLSLQNTYTIDEVTKWYLKTGEESFIIEEKIDGVALSLIYEKGKFIRAVTRGDGTKGDDVTNNAMQVDSILKQIPYKKGNLEIRGEVIIPITYFNKINAERSNEGLEAYSNTRNLASGTIKLHDSNEVKKRGLQFIGYEICLEDRPQTFATQENKLNWLSKVGFNIPHYVIINREKRDPSDVLLNLKNGVRGRDYNIDGAVFKVNEVSGQDKIGIGNKYPKWAIAYKYSAEQAKTKLQCIEFNVGRSGVVTPIAILKPVELCGTIISRATLHNADFIENLGLSIGCKVIIEKGGEIIPKIVKVVKHKEGAKPFKFPKKCPKCSSILYRNEGEARWYCPDTYGLCTKNFEKFYHFASKEALDIQGLGEETLNLLIKSGRINSLVDLYKLKMDDLLGLEGFKTKSAEKLIYSIQDSLNKPMSRWLFALGIPMIGSITAKNICKKYKTWYSIRLTSKNTSADSVANEKLFTWFKDDKNWDLVKSLKGIGMPKRYHEVNKVTSDILKGEKITITGSFGQYTRDFLVNKIITLGGEYNDSLKATTTLLLMGDDVGKNKIEKAAKWNIKTLSKTETLNLLNI